MTSKKLSLVIVICVAPLLCAFKKLSVKTEEQLLNSDLKYNSFLYVVVDSDRSLNSIEIKGEKNISIEYENLQKGKNHILVNIPDGRYTMYKVRKSEDEYIKLKGRKKYWRFTVLEGRTNYVGHLKVKSIWNGLYLDLENNSSYAYQYLAEEYPSIIELNPPSYAGIGEDFFFDLMGSGEEGIVEGVGGGKP